MQAYFIQCSTKREMKYAKAIAMKNRRPAIQGVCVVCGSKMFEIEKSWRKLISVEVSEQAEYACTGTRSSL